MARWINLPHVLFLFIIWYHIRIPKNIPFLINNFIAMELVNPSNDTLLSQEINRYGNEEALGMHSRNENEVMTRSPLTVPPRPKTGTKRFVAGPYSSQCISNTPECGFRPPVRSACEGERGRGGRMDKMSKVLERAKMVVGMEVDEEGADDGADSTLLDDFNRQCTLSTKQVVPTFQRVYPIHPPLPLNCS